MDKSESEVVDLTQYLELTDELTRAVEDEFDDGQAMLVFEGRLEGMSRKEIRELVGLSETEYESLEKRIRRFAIKHINGKNDHGPAQK